MTKAVKIEQGTDSIEVYYGKLVALWKEIDRRTPNPMECAKYITSYNRITQQHRLYKFLAGINDSLDKERRDITH